MVFTHVFRFRLSALALSAGMLLVTSPQARAADVATTCETAKLKATGQKAECLAREEGKAMLGRPSNPARCVNAFTTAFSRAEATAAAAGGACPVTGDVNAVEALVDSCVDDWVATIGGTPSSPCAQFPASGQTTVYTADKNDGIAGAVAIPDDGTVQAGATLSYTDNGDGTVTDNNTGLMWEKKSNLDGNLNFANLHDADNVYLWSGTGSDETIWDWIGDVDVEGVTGYAGYNDWRVPNVKELQSIIDYNISSPNPRLSATFGPTDTVGYWSSTSSVDSPLSAWVVNFGAGDVNFLGKSGAAARVRAVRGGQ